MMAVILTNAEKNTALSFVAGLLEVGVPIAHIPQVSQNAISDFFSAKEHELSVTEREKHSFRTPLSYAIRIECEALAAKGEK